MAQGTPSLLKYAFIVLIHTLNEQIKEIRAFFYRFLIQEKDSLASDKGNKST